MQNGDDASPSIIFAGRPLLVKILITLEPHGIFRSKFAYFCILTLYGHWYAKRHFHIAQIMFLIQNVMLVGGPDEKYGTHLKLS